MANVSERNYEDFAPVSDLVSEKDCDTLLLYLPGFRKEQLKVQLTPSRILRVSGERPIGDNKWKRFLKEFQVESNINAKDMTAKFEGGILYIRQPKLITPEVKEQKDEEKPAEKEPPKTQEQEKPEESQKPPEQEPPKSDIPSEKKMEKEGEEKKGKSKIEEINEKLRGQTKLFKELRRPEKLKKLGVFAIVLLIVGIQVIKMFRSFSKVEEHSILENGHQEL